MYNLVYYRLLLEGVLCEKAFGRLSEVSLVSHAWNRNPLELTRSICTIMCWFDGNYGLLVAYCNIILQVVNANKLNTFYSKNTVKFPLVVHLNKGGQSK